VDGGFRGEGVKGAIQMRAELYAVIGELTEAAQAEDLKAAGIGEDGVGPGHETMQTAELADKLGAGTQEQVIGVRQQDLDAQLFGEVALSEAFDGGLGADGHEYRRFDRAVRGVEPAGARAGLRALGEDLEGD